MLTLTLTVPLTLLNPNICAHIVDTHNNFFQNLYSLALHGYLYWNSLELVIDQ